MGVSRKETPKKGRDYVPQGFKIQKVMGVPTTPEKIKKLIHRRMGEERKKLKKKFSGRQPRSRWGSPLGLGVHRKFDAQKRPK